MHFQSRIIINASREQVFNAISDAHLFPQFDPNCLKLEGTIKKGAQIKFFPRQQNNKPLVMVVSLVEKNNKIIWEKSWPFNLYKRMRIFGVYAKDDHTTEFTIEEVFSGHFLNFLTNKIPNMENEFRIFTKGLKKFLESR